MRQLFFATMVITVIGFTSIALCIFGSAANLAWLPFFYHQQTRIVHASQGYIEAQRSELRVFKTDYDVATNPAQRAADLLQMQDLADRLRPEDIQPDIAALLRR